MFQNNIFNLSLLIFSSNGSKYKFCILPEAELSGEIIALTANAADPDSHLAMITQGTFNPSTFSFSVFVYTQVYFMFFLSKSYIKTMKTLKFLHTNTSYKYT